MEILLYILVAIGLVGVIIGIGYLVIIFFAFWWASKAFPKSKNDKK